MRRRTVLLGGLAALALLLTVPGPDPSAPPAPSGARSFAWNRDAYWHDLERRFAAARAAGCAESGPAAAREVTILLAQADGLADRPLDPDHPVLDSLEQRFFQLSARIAACPEALHDYIRLHQRLRAAVKDLARHWDLTTAPARDRLYRALYGTRAAVEEVMLHHPGVVPALLPGREEPSATPAAVVEGVTIHSGDMLVSRGGYPTSALIARGNDYPGNFSHVALVHVDSATGAVSTIEAHIERGVSIGTGEQYLRDKKLRILVLRLRADLPAITADPLLPHRAASLALDRARSGHIPYDFTMDYTDPSRLFCSEVASSVYRDLGITLWTGLSTISAPGLRRWLASFGVRHFETQEPSDLEYDPQLVAVAEWRDGDALFLDHVDTAVIDAMLEAADAGDRIDYAWYRLPAARAAKGWSWLLNRVGRIGPIPEGMAPRAALRNRAFSDRQRALAAAVASRAHALANELGYPPPYWRLVELARDVSSASRAGGRAARPATHPSPG